MKANSILKTAFVSFAIMFIVINGCEKEPEYQLKDKYNDNNNKVATNVVVFSSNELNNISSFNYSTGTMTFINTVNYSIGDIIVGEMTTSAPDGLLRKVTGYSGGETIYTEQATIEEAIVDGYLEGQIQLTSNGKRGKGSGKIEKLAGVELIENAASGFDFNFKMTNIVLYDVDGNTLTTNDQITINGFINLSNTFDVKLSIKNGKLEYFLFQNVVNEESQIDINANVSISTNKEVIIWSQNFGGIVIGFIGPVPIVVTPQLDIKVGVDGSVSVSTINVLQNVTLTGGIKYENSQWGNVNNFTNYFTFNNPIVSANINAKGYASASLSVLLYGVAGPYAEPSIYARLDASTSPSLSWNLYGGLEVIVGVKIQALSKTLAEYSATVISNEKILAQYDGSGSAPIANFTANTTTISVGGSVNFTDLSLNSPTSWSWDFGDGGTSTAQNPSHLYSSVGTYDVSLTATNSYGSDIETKIGHITVGGTSSSKIAFSSNRDGNYEIYVMNVDGTNQTRLTYTSANNTSPAWSPDGTKIVFTSDRVGNIDLNGSALREIYVMNADGTNQTRLTITNDTITNIHPNWSPDGSKIAFVKQTTTTDSITDIFTMNIDGSNQINLTNTGSFPQQWHPDWSSTGSEITYAVVGGGTEGIYKMTSNGSNQTSLINCTSCYGPIFSPDNTRILFFENDMCACYELYTINSDGSNKTQLTYDNAFNGSPDWSHDGSKIIFQSNKDMGTSSEIYIMNSDGSNPIRLTSNSSEDVSPAWSPN